MDWHAAEGSADAVQLAQALIPVTSRLGWNRQALAAASLQVFQDPRRWRQVFPGGSRQAIWFISQVSDASMRVAFAASPASGMTAVIEERFAQNHDLKAFVRRVMMFDMAHPFQALARMQRTARVMFDCLAQGGPRSDGVRQSTLNLAYTGLVFIWLFDKTPGNRRTSAATRQAMKILDL